MRNDRPQKPPLSKGQKQKYEQLKSFSVDDYRRHLETGFRELPFQPDDREQLRSYVAGSPLDARFWQILRLVEEQNPQLPSDVKKLQDDFRQTFTEHYAESLPDGWVNIATNVLFAVDYMQRHGEFVLREPNLLTAQHLGVMYRTNWQKFPSAGHEARPRHAR